MRWELLQLHKDYKAHDKRRNPQPKNKASTKNAIAKPRRFVKAKPKSQNTREVGFWETIRLRQVYDKTFPQDKEVSPDSSAEEEEVQQV